MQTDCFPDSVADWTKAPVGMLAFVNPRYPVKNGHDYPFIEMASVGENFFGIRRVDWRKLESSGLARFKTGDTLFAKITPCPENGKVAFVSALPDEVGLGSTEFIVLSPLPGTDPRFLFHLVCSHEVRGRAVARMEGSTGRQRVPEEVFRKRLLVPVPAPDEQAAVARILDAVDTALERTRTTIERARQLHISTLSDAFHRLKAVRMRLGEYTSDVRYGTSRASNERSWGNPTLRIPNIVKDQLSLDDVTCVALQAAEIERLKLRDEDLLLVRTNGNPDYVGRSAVFRAPDDRTWLYASYLIRVRLRNGLSPDYVNAYMGIERGRRELLRRVTTSAGNHNINSNSIRLISIPIPDDHEEQNRIVALAQASRTYLDKKSQTQALDRTQPGLPMKRALRSRSCTIFSRAVSG
jgi:type I restriction enzyme, S subunit